MDSVCASTLFVLIENQTGTKTKNNSSFAEIRLKILFIIFVFQTQLVGYRIVTRTREHTRDLTVNRYIFKPQNKSFLNFTLMVVMCIDKTSLIIRYMCLILTSMIFIFEAFRFNRANPVP